MSRSLDEDLDDEAAAHPLLAALADELSAALSLPVYYLDGSRRPDSIPRTADGDQAGEPGSSGV